MIHEKWQHNKHSLQFSNPVMKPMEENGRVESVDDTSHFYYDVAVVDDKDNRMLLKTRVNETTVISELPEAIEKLLKEDLTVLGNAFLLDDTKEDGFEREVRYAAVDLHDAIERSYGVKMERFDYHIKQEGKEDGEWTEYRLVVSQPILFTEDGVTRVSHVESVTLLDLTAEDLLRLKETATRFLDAAMFAANHAETTR